MLFPKAVCWNRMPLSVVWCCCFEWWELVGGRSSWCLQAPEGTWQNGAHSWGPSGKIYFPWCFPAVLLWLCKLPELWIAPGSWCSRIFWVVEGGVLLPSALWSLGSSETMKVLYFGAADEVPLVLLQALLNPGWPCTNQALVVGALCPVVKRFSKRWLLRSSHPEMWLGRHMRDCLVCLLLHVASGQWEGEGDNGGFLLCCVFSFPLVIFGMSLY